MQPVCVDDALEAHMIRPSPRRSRGRPFDPSPVFISDCAAGRHRAPREESRCSPRRRRDIDERAVQSLDAAVDGSRTSAVPNRASTPGGQCRDLVALASEAARPSGLGPSSTPLRDVAVEKAFRPDHDLRVRSLPEGLQRRRQILRGCKRPFSPTRGAQATRTYAASTAA